jgi:arylsulfatase A-like enzyme
LLTALVGKWHLGDADHYPETHGFDVNIGGSHWGAPRTFWWPYRGSGRFGPEFRYVPHLEFGQPGEYLTDRLTDEALKVIDQSTIVIFASDNGGFIGADSRDQREVPVTSNFPLRSGKGSCYEGGIRVPLIVRWPGMTTSHSECDEPVAVMDLFPTLLNAAGVSPPNEVVLDGINLLPLLRAPEARLDRDALFFHFPHYYPTTTPVSAVRTGEWKLLEFLEDDRIELFHLKNDSGETTNLASEQAAKARDLRDRLHHWREEIGAPMPRPNPGVID